MSPLSKQNTTEHYLCSHLSKKQSAFIFKTLFESSNCFAIDVITNIISASEMLDEATLTEYKKLHQSAELELRQLGVVLQYYLNIRRICKTRGIKRRRTEKGVKPQEKASRKSSITARINSGFHCPTLIIESGCANRISSSAPPTKKNVEPNQHLTAVKVEVDQKLSEKNKNPFDCFTGGCRMHRTKQSTYLNKDAMEGHMALGENALLLCNACVDDKQTDQLIKESGTKSE